MFIRDSAVSINLYVHPQLMAANTFNVGAAAGCDLLLFRQRPAKAEN